jgi:multicomponent Na+:H+ antiporter subunit D
MTAWLLIPPLIIPLAGAALLLATRHHIAFQRAGAVFFSVLTFAFSLALVVTVDKAGHLVTQVSNWAAPFGITLVADRLGAAMVCISSFMGAAVALYSLGEIGERRIRKSFYPLYLILLFGVNGAFLTGDLFNLYVWFEVMLIASFVLTAMGGGRAELEGSLKYVCLNLVASGLFLISAGLIYGQTGTLNMADLAMKIAASPDAEWILPSASLLLTAFAIKAGLFPLFFWLPAAYHTPPPAVSAIFAGLLTKVGVYALIRANTLFLAPVYPHVEPILLVLAVLTMATGVFGAASQFDMRRVLSFHIISQVGYMALGLALMTPLALAAAVFYIIHHIIVKTNLFLVSGVVIRLRGTSDLAKLGGLYKSAPWLAVLFFIPAFSLGGIPPLSGFWAKFSLVKAAMDASAWISVTVALLVGIMTLFSMTKIWAEAFWKTPPEEKAPSSEKTPPGSLAWMVFPIALLALCTSAIGFFGTPLFAFAERSAEQLLDPSQYIQAVLSPPSAAPIP